MDGNKNSGRREERFTRLFSQGIGPCLRWGLCLTVVLMVWGGSLYADPAAFDLSGPSIEVKVTRAGKTLPIAQVANLAPGDRIWIHPALPADESVHYLLVAAFLRGSTNPPPENWFFKAEAWTKNIREEGMVITVPAEAKQLLLFLAPDTRGAFSTLRAAVRGKPGAFVRASQDLNQASLDRSRLEKYLSAIKQISQTDPASLHERSTLLAHSLKIKLDQQCFDKPTEEQAPCLTQQTDQLVLDDGNAQSAVSTLASGANADLLGQISSSRLAGGGAYSPYIGAVVDVARIMGNLHTASYQYIPALALPEQDQLSLRLNNPPSFRKPMSVLVASLPPVRNAPLPSLHAQEADRVSCLQAPSLVLPVEASSLVFSTDFAHDFVLHMTNQAGKSVDLQATADAAHGGFVVDTHALAAADLPPEVEGKLGGYWGFQPWDGPAFPLQNAHPVKWDVAAKEENQLTVGRENTLHLHANAAACVVQVDVQDQKKQRQKASWKLVKRDELEVKAPLPDGAPGTVTVFVQQYGSAPPDEVRLQAYAQSGQLDEFTISTGDSQGVLTGTRLDEVASLDFSGLHFVPAGQAHLDQKDELYLSAANAFAGPLSGQESSAHATLKDGRVLDLPAKVEPPSPKVTLVSKSLQTTPGSNPSALRLSNRDDLPQDQRLTFFVKAVKPATFPNNLKIEVATPEEVSHVSLSLADGSLMLQDSRTVRATLDPLKSFGPSAFGPLRFRPVVNGLRGNWQPLANLVRLPALKEIRCPDSPERQCALLGTELFLIDSVAADGSFTNKVSVPEGFAGSSLSVPRPNGTLLYLKLRDDPAAVNVVVLPVLPERQ